MRRFPLGGWPAIGLSDARDKAGSMREKVKGGADPIAEARKLRAIGRDAKAGIGTLSALLDLYGGPVAKKGEAAETDAEAPKARVIGPGKELRTWPETRKWRSSLPAASRPSPHLQPATPDAADAYAPISASAAAGMSGRSEMGSQRNTCARGCAYRAPAR